MVRWADGERVTSGMMRRRGKAGARRAAPDGVEHGGAERNLGERRGLRRRGLPEELPLLFRPVDPRLQLVGQAEREARDAALLQLAHLRAGKAEARARGCRELQAPCVVLE